MHYEAVEVPDYYREPVDPPLYEAVYSNTTGKAEEVREAMRGFLLIRHLGLESFETKFLQKLLTLEVQKDSIATAGRLLCSMTPLEPKARIAELKTVLNSSDFIEEMTTAIDRVPIDPSIWEQLLVIPEQCVTIHNDIRKQIFPEKLTSKEKTQIDSCIKILDIARNDILIRVSNMAQAKLYGSAKNLKTVRIFIGTLEKAAEILPRDRFEQFMVDLQETYARSFTEDSEELKSFQEDPTQLIAALLYRNANTESERDASIKLLTIYADESRNHATEISLLLPGEEKAPPLARAEIVYCELLKKCPGSLQQSLLLTQLQETTAEKRIKVYRRYLEKSAESPLTKTLSKTRALPPEDPRTQKPFLLSSKLPS